jgi:hypothetical protein
MPKAKASAKHWYVRRSVDRDVDLTPSGTGGGRPGLWPPAHGAVEPMWRPHQRSRRLRRKARKRRSSLPGPNRACRCAHLRRRVPANVADVNDVLAAPDDEVVVAEVVAG